MAFNEVKTPINYPDLEKQVLENWEKGKIFEKSVSSRPEGNPFVFYEGPPTANGKPGIHHVISRCIKDFVCRFKTMQGFRVSRKAGWDTHGLPVEIEIEKQLGFTHKEEIEAYGVDKFNQKCRDSVFKYVKEWNELTRRIGYWVDLDNPYITYTNEYIESVWYLLAQMWKKDLLYQGFKILPYCSRCETSLSSHETSLGYKEVKDRSVVAKFALVDKPNEFILAWTTTPWTLPGNVALAVGADITYVAIQQDKNGIQETYYLAEDRLEMIQGDYEILKKIKGTEIEGWKYHPLFDFVNLEDEEHPAYFVATADFVTTEEGTGVVHTAVMYGEDDYRLGLRLGLPAKHTVDEHGHFNEHVSKWKDQYVKDPDTEHDIIHTLKETGRLYKQAKYTHSYPHCWRCEAPLLYYAKKSWYIRTTAMRDQLIANNEEIQWYPKEVGTGRFGRWLENNVDWALSRDRYWGTPLNVWLCESCGKQQAIESVDELEKLSNQDKIKDLHKPHIDEITLTCPDCKATMRRTPEVLDCWFDSGAMPYAQFHYPFNKDGSFEKQFPADFIAEGVDQTRGWFYSLLAISTLVTGTPSYKSCISIEMILDKDGQKMSKTRGNAVDPFKIINKYGADTLRWYLYTVSPPWVPTRFDEDGVIEVQRKFFGTLMNTYSFFVLYANIDSFTYQEPHVAVENRSEIDRWLISEKNALVMRVNDWLSRYEITKAARAIQEFVIDDLSNWYVRRNRRRFWKSEMGSDKQSAYETLYECLYTLSKLIAPFAPFTADEIYQNISQSDPEALESVHLTLYPTPDEPLNIYRDEKLEQRMRLVRTVVTLCLAARNEAGIKVRQPLERAIVVVSGDGIQKSIQEFEALILDELNINKLEFAQDTSDLYQKEAKPVFRNLGPKFGSHVNQVAEIIRKFSEEEIQKLENGESLHISVNGGKHGEIELKDVEIELTAPKGLEVQTDSDITVALDTKLNEDLVVEGLAREFVNRIQNMRKEAGFSVTDRIEVHYEASSALHRAIRFKSTEIQTEILAAMIHDQFDPADFEREWQIDHETVKVGIKRLMPSAALS
ncbi:isoleucine--tRNA ligase [candidate division KSB1 bacterium]|nr:isoleucine--tRNA ligase [candidate division KSB1 bacterium]